MANAITNIDLADLHTAIGSNLSEAFPAFKLVEFYREDEERAAPKESELPALLLEMTEMEPDLDSDPGTEQLAVIARFEARIVINFRTPKAKIEVRKMAGGLAAFIHKNRRFHKLPTGAANIDAIVSDDFYPELDRFQVWRVDFSMLVHLGDTIWTNDEPLEFEPVYSWSPETGTGNDDKYEGV